MISLTTIPSDLRVPGAYFEFDNTQATQGKPGQRRLSLIPATMDEAAGSATPGEIYLIDSDARADELFGRTSMLAAMIRAFRAMTKFAELYACGLVDGTTAAVKALTFTVTGTTTAAVSSLPIYVGGVKVLVAIAEGLDAAGVAAAVHAQLGVDADDLIVTATVALGVVSLTLNFKGEVGSDLDIRLGHHSSDRWDSNIAMAVAETTPGAGNSALSAAVTALGSTQYNVIANPFTDATNLTALENVLASRWEGMSHLDGHSYSFAPGTVSELGTLGNSRNSPHVSTFGLEGSPTPPWIFAAQVAAARAKNPDTSAQIRGTRLPDCMAPKAGVEFDDTQRNTLLFDGISTLVVNQAGEVYIDQAITTYQTNPGGTADPSYYKEVTMTNLSTMRFDVRTLMGLKFGNHKLAPNGTKFKPGAKVATPEKIEEKISGLYRSWIDDDARAYDYEGFAAEMRVEIPTSDENRVNIHVPPRCIKHLDVAAGSLAFR